MERGRHDAMVALAGAGRGGFTFVLEGIWITISYT